MRSGDLRQRIEIQIPTRALNSINELIDTYTTQDTVWGAIEPLSGNRLILAQQSNSQVQGLIRIRYRKGIVPRMRLKVENRYFQIISIVDRDELHKEIQLFYKEIVE